MVEGEKKLQKLSSDFHTRACRINMVFFFNFYFFNLSGCGDGSVGNTFAVQEQGPKFRSSKQVRQCTNL